MLILSMIKIIGYITLLVVIWNVGSGLTKIHDSYSDGIESAYIHGRLKEH